MDNPLSKLELKYWYHVLIAASIFFLFLSLTIPFVGIDNSMVQKLSLGTFFIGLGEWKNHPIQTRYIPNGDIATSYPRNNSISGWVLNIIGLVFVFLSFNS